MQKVFASRLKDTTFSFFKDDEKHLKQVLRIKLNDQLICIFEQKKYLTKIVNLEPLLAEICEIITNETEFQGLDLVLFQAVIKPKHMEWILAKATELQVTKIVPILFNRSQTNNLIKLERMENIVYSAAKQSNRNIVPEVQSVIPFKEMLSHIESFDLVIVPYENEEGHYLGEVLRELKITKTLESIGIIVGPEGGFSEQEIIELKKRDNVYLVGLSKTILRSDTASFYSLSVIIDWLVGMGY